CSIPKEGAMMLHPMNRFWIPHMFVLTLLLSLLAGTIGLTLPTARAEGVAAHPASLVIVERSIAQDQGGWQVDYRLRFDASSGMGVTPSEIFAKVEGWVSNSRVPSHTTAHWSSLALSGPSGPSVSGDVISAADEAKRCRERALLHVRTGDGEV